MRGGQRPGAGRPKGARNRRTEALAAALASTAADLAQAIPDAFPGDAHALLMAVYKNPALDLTLRLDAAKAAVRYERPALSSIDSEVHQRLNATVETITPVDALSLTPEQRTTLRDIVIAAGSGLAQ